VPKKSNDFWGGDLYTIDDSESSHGPSRNSTSTPSVKQEPDDAFVMEFSNCSSLPSVFEHPLAPPTEVPLRATQASKEMRKMMGVFRLNPFTMHNGSGRGTATPSWNGEDAGPLEEEPHLYEFQLLVEATVEHDTDEALRSLSPDFDIGDDSVKSDDPPQNEWTDYGSTQGMSPSFSRRPSAWDHAGAHMYASPTGTSASLELEHPDSSADPQGGN
jgi:hypothetical protein